MPAEIVDRTEAGFTLQITVPYNSSMLDFEEALQNELNEAGVLATQEQLKQFDSDGSPIVVGAVKLTSKGQLPKEYQTPYGAVTVARHVYQGPQGGSTFCPLDRDARIIVSSTPRFAKIVSSKYAEFGSSRVQKDLKENHGRRVSRCLIQDIADAVAAVALAKEESWSYSLPRLLKPPSSIGVSLDGTCVLMCEDGWRETMVGTISLYDRQGERQHTIYLAATPEYGKTTFLGRLESEVLRIKEKYPDARFVGIADGAKANWEFLEKHTSVQVVDFWHAAEYLGKAATVLFRRDSKVREIWMDEQCHTLKYEPRGAAIVLKKLKSQLKARPWAKDDENVERAITYFTNQNAARRMNYAARVRKKEPIGSGVAEAACKVIVKQRLCASGMKWKEKGAASVLSVRSLTHTTDRWRQFWTKIDRWGYPVELR